MDTSKAVPIAQAWRDEVGIAEVRVPSAPKAPHAPLTSEDLTTVLHEIRILAGRRPGGGSLHEFRNPDGFRLQFAYEMFDRRSPQLDPTGVQVADLAAQLLQPLQARGASIELVGHASADEEGALDLSLKRAHETLRRMTRPESPYRLDPRGMLAAGRGAHEPAADGADSSGRALNRRVEFVVRLATKP
jgi:outer membrane protein OmpA-like peptidoglycan-associated protein